MFNAMDSSLDVPEGDDSLAQATRSSPQSDPQYVNMDNLPMMHHHAIPPFVIRATAIASLGGILFGYDMGVVSGALPQLTEAFQLTQGQQETVVSVLYLGGGLGAALGGAVCDMLGRKRTILIVDVWFVGGAAILFWARSIGHLIAGRIVVGVAVSVSGIADVSYLHEIAPREWRGSIVSVNEACISLGFLLAYVAGYSIDMLEPESGWRTMFGISGLVAMLQFAGMLYMPESPIWLQEKGHNEQSRKALRVIHGGVDPPDLRVSEEKSSSEKSASVKSRMVGEEALFRRSRSYDAVSNKGSRVERPLCERSNSDSLFASTRRSFQQLRRVLQRYHRQVAIAFMLSITQQLCGQTPVLNYAPLIFASVGLTSNHSTLGSTLLIGLVKFTVTVLVIWRIEYWGRRFLLLTGMSIIAAGLLLLTVAFSTDMHENDDEVGGGGVYLALPGVLLVVLGYSASFGPLTWLLTSELFPTDIRGRALGMSTIVTYLCASFVTYTFLSWQSWLGANVVFATYCTITVCGILFAYLAIPDTGDKTVDEVATELQNMWWWRRGTIQDGSLSPMSWRKGLPIVFAEVT